MKIFSSTSLLSGEKDQFKDGPSSCSLTAPTPMTRRLLALFPEANAGPAFPLIYTGNNRNCTDRVIRGVDCVKELIDCILGWDFLPMARLPWLHAVLRKKL